MIWSIIGLFCQAQRIFAVQLYSSSIPTCSLDFHPLERAHVGRAKNGVVSKQLQELERGSAFFVYGGMWITFPKNRKSGHYIPEGTVSALFGIRVCSAGIFQQGIVIYSKKNRQADHADI
jgi:hypothetical protein